MAAIVGIALVFIGLALVVIWVTSRNNVYERRNEPR